MTKNEVAVQQHDHSKALRERSGEEQFTAPAADIYETPEAFVVMLDMPGATKETINISIDRTNLTVKGPASVLHTGNATLLHNEIPAFGFYRAFHLGEEINRNNVDANLEEGVLTIKLYKKEEVKPKEIRIK